MACAHLHVYALMWQCKLTQLARARARAHQNMHYCWFISHQNMRTRPVRFRSSCYVWSDRGRPVSGCACTSHLLIPCPRRVGHALLRLSNSEVILCGPPHDCVTPADRSASTQHLCMVCHPRLHVRHVEVPVRCGDACDCAVVYALGRRLRLVRIMCVWLCVPYLGIARAKVS